MTRIAILALALALALTFTACAQAVPVPQPCGEPDGGTIHALAYDHSAFWEEAVAFCQIQGGRVGSAAEISLACTVHPSGPRIRNDWDCMATDGYVRSSGAPRPGDEIAYYGRVACVFP